MFKNLDPSNKSIKPFEVYKNFTSTHNDSGSGVFAISAVSSSYRNYISSSDTNTQVVSGSTTTNYFALPTWNLLNNMFYKNHREYDYVGKVSKAGETTKYHIGHTQKPFNLFSINDYSKQTRELNTTAQVINVAKDLIGEKIKPESVKLSATVGGVTFDIRDDGDGNLYDFAHSASFAAYKSSSFDRIQGVSTTAATLGSGSEVGNVMYEQGLLVITDTGSYSEVGKAGTTFSLEHQSTHRIYQHEYITNAKPNEFNMTSNVSITQARSGFVYLPQTASLVENENDDRDFVYKLFPPHHKPTLSGTGSFESAYTTIPQAIDPVTSSTWYPYVTQVGLYDDNEDLLAVGKLAHPIKLSSEIDTTFVVRFDV